MEENIFVDLVWREMLNQCAVNPKVAKRLVLVNKEDVEKAMRKVLEKVNVEEKPQEVL